MDGKSMARTLALALFVSCGVSAFCLGTLSFTLTTGDLPFGLTPLIREHRAKTTSGKERLTSPKDKEGPGSEGRAAEQYLSTFYEDLNREKEKIAEERKKLSEEEKVAKETLMQAQKMQAEINNSESRVKNLLKTIDEKEMKNMLSLTALISGLETAQAGKMLMELDDETASRILWLMNKKTASLVLTELIRNSTEKDMERIKKFSKIMQVLSDAKSVQENVNQ